MDQTPDMDREPTSLPPGKVPLPPTYGTPDYNDIPPAPCCWQCKCYSLCCGGASQLPFRARFQDFVGANVLWLSGMYWGGTPDRQRVEALISKKSVAAGEDVANGVRSWDTTVPSTMNPGYHIRVRIFAPMRPLDKKSSVIVYFHGGGWCLGHPNMPGFHNLGTELAKVGHVVVSVDYRLAPEDPFPAGLFDCFDVCRWVATRPASEPCFAGIDVSRLILGGDSAGGNLAMVIATLVRDGLGADLQPTNCGFSISQLLLIYPSFMMRRFVKETSPGNLPFLSKPVADFFFVSYVPGETIAEKRKLVERERRICPLLAGLHNLPRCIMVSGGEDFLRFENTIAADIMKQGDTPVTHHVIPHQPHGFLAIDNHEPARQCVAQMIKDLSEG